MQEIKKPSIVVVGCGYWGKNLVRNFSELNALVGVCDAHQSAAERMSEQYKVPVLSWEQVLENSEISALAIATPAVQHAECARQALEAGKHVFVEKPLSLKISDAEQLCRLSARLDRRLMVGHLMSYHPAFRKLREMVSEGKLGRIQYIYSSRLNFGQIRREEDILWSFAPHDISMILALIGHEPEQVTAIGGYYLHKTIADVTTTHLTFASGEQAHIFVSWLHPFKEQKLIVVGDQGMAVLDDGQPFETKLLFYPHSVQWREGMPMPSKAEAIPIMIDRVEPLREECKHFLDCIMQGATPRTDGHEGLRVLKVLDRASRSLKGIPDSLTQVKNENSRRFPEVSIHESAYIDENVKIGAGTTIWHFSHLLPYTEIGQNVIIGQNVVIGPKVKVGNNCKIQNNVSLYTGVTLEDGVFCGPSCVFTNVNTPRAEINRKAEFKVTWVGRGATIGANATIVCGNKLGAYCFIAAGAVVTKDVQPYALMAGVPARRIGWVSETGERLGEDLICPRTSERYRVNSSGNLEKMVEEAHETAT